MHDEVIQQTAAFVKWRGFEAQIVTVTPHLVNATSGRMKA
jgi:hypothetical protein